MCRIVAVVHQKPSLLENKTIKLLATRRAENHDKVAMINLGDGKIELSTRDYDILSFNKMKVEDIRKMNYNSVFVHIPIQQITKNENIINDSDLLVVASVNSVLNLQDYKSLNKIFKSESLYNKSTIIFER